jgi:endonuclease/exonuclease/phosphatase family metal-dependent hydrolase
MSDLFTVMSWNVENLFPPGDAIVDGMGVSEEQYAAKLDYLVQTIASIGPDLIALQEIGGKGRTPRPIVDLLARLGSPWTAAASAHPDGRGIRVAVLSRHELSGGQHDVVRFPPGELSGVPDWHGRKRITEMGRGALAVTVTRPSGLRVRVITAHLKSKLISYPSENGHTRFQPHDEDERANGTALALLRRTAEAVCVRRYANGVMNETDALVLMGDLNDEPRAATSQLLRGPDDRDAGTADGLDGPRLYNLFDAIPLRGGPRNDHWFVAPERRFTRLFVGRRELIDHIFCSRNLLGTPAQVRDGQWAVKQVDSLVESITDDIGPDPGERVGRLHPDHAPVFARFAA